MKGILKILVDVVGSKKHTHIVPPRSGTVPGVAAIPASDSKQITTHLMTSVLIFITVLVSFYII